MNRACGFAILVSFLTGCGPRSEPLTFRPSEAQIVGKWTVVDSPRSVLDGVSLPDSKGAFIVFRTNGIAELNGVLVEKRRVSEQGLSLYSWTKVSASGAWEVQQWTAGGDASAWRIVVTPRESQAMQMPILVDRTGSLRLRYRPDPEMAVPFIFMKDTHEIP